MATGHAHSETPPRLRVGRWSRLSVIGLVVLSGVVAVFGMLHWWPDSDRVDELRGLIPFAVDGIEVVHGELDEVLPACTGAEGDETCGDSSVRVLDGDSAGQTVELSLTPDVIATGLRSGDRVLLFDSTAVSDGTSPAFSFYRADRGSSLLWLAILFAIAVVAVAWRRGLMALVSLAFAGVVVIGYLLPALLSGQPAVPVTLAASVLILVVMLYVTHGFSMRTSVALAGALVGVGLSTLFSWIGIVGSRLAGYGDEVASLLTINVSWIDVQDLVVASVILAGLGTLNDVTVTQASALWELRSASPSMSRWALFRSAMRIGRDHVASTVYTLVFAYLGTALVLLVAVQLYGGTAYDFVTAEDVAQEIVRALVGGLALVLAMPVTTAIGTLVVAGAAPEDDDVVMAAPAHGEGRGRHRRSDAAERRSARGDDVFWRQPDNPWDE